MHFTSLFALGTAGAALALSGVSVGLHEARSLIKRHRALAARAASTRSTAPLTRRAGGPRRLTERKVLGDNDSATPSHIAEGTFTAAQGCAVWHTVQDGEVCLGLIDKSSTPFNLAKFFEFNPSLQSDCSNLATGLAYCVDTVAGAASSKTQTAKTETVDTPTTPRVAAVQTTNDDVAAGGETAKSKSATSSTSTDSTDGEDCDDAEESDDAAADSEEEDCDSEDENSNSNTVSSKSSASTAEEPKTQVKAKIAPSSSSSAEQSEETGSDDSGSSKSSSGSSDTNMDQSGTATYYTQNGNAGNCGDTNPDTALIVALYTPQYENGAHCGKYVELRNSANGNTVKAKVADSCPSCETNGNIDCSVAVFKALSDDNLGLGVLSVEWGFI